jgi:hypothetical protein
MIAFLVTAGGLWRQLIDSLPGLPIFPQTIEKNKPKFFGTKIVGQKRCYFKKRT